MSTVQEYVDAIKSTLADLQAEAQGHIDRIAEYRDKEQATKEDLRRAKEEFDKRCISFEESELTIKSRYEEAHAKTVEAEGELATLVAKKGNLLIENGKLEELNIKFKNYEERAWKLLNTKDAELKARENTIAEREQFTPKQNTFLPPQ